MLTSLVLVDVEEEPVGKWCSTVDAEMWDSTFLTSFVFPFLFVEFACIFLLALISALIFEISGFLDSS